MVLELTNGKQKGKKQGHKNSLLKKSQFLSWFHFQPFLVCFATVVIICVTQQLQHTIMVIWGVPSGDSRGCCNQGNRDKTYLPPVNIKIHSLYRHGHDVELPCDIVHMISFNHIYKTNSETDTPSNKFSIFPFLFC